MSFYFVWQDYQVTKIKKASQLQGFKRAEDEARTRDNQLGRLELYQLSYFRR
jgi:hypothetical protein